MTMERQARRSSPQGETFILLGSDGRHVLLGRHGEPDAAEMERIIAHLAAQKLGGWVALMRGDYWQPRGRVRVQMIREAAPSPTPFDQAEAAFQARRQGALAP
ncbi:MAG TPA: hypothetical protein VIL69_13860 [Roseomonas sp.]|jgi:hypothetical protein